MLTLKGRTALVSGAAGIVGYKIVQKFLQGGMNVVSLHSRPEKAEMVAKELKEYGDQFLPLSGEIEDVLSKVIEKYERLDVIVLTHGWPPINQDFYQINLEYWNSVMLSNMTSGFFMLQKAIPYLKNSPAPRVIFLTSAEARSGGYYDGLAYTAAKGGIISLSFSLARRLAPYGITVNSIAMGGIYNKPFPIEDKDHDDSLIEYTEMLNDIPLGRLVKPDDVAFAVCYLASEEASFVTGDILNVNGGLSIG